LALFSGTLRNEITVTPRQSLRWKTGVDGPPYLEVHASSIEYFSELLRTRPGDLERYHTRAEVLYFDKRFLSDETIQFFNVVTAPPGLIRGWYMEAELYEKYRKGELQLRSRMRGRAELGVVKTEESSDFTYAKGLPHIELSQRWLPISLAAMSPYAWYRDWQSSRPGCLLLEGGSLYQILKFEVKTAPDYPTRFRLLEKLPGDRYPEVYLRAVLPGERAAT
jgi:hypothetical protein